MEEIPCKKTPTVDDASGDVHREIDTRMIPVIAVIGEKTISGKHQNLMSVDS
jgi:hypothetical protein